MARVITPGCPRHITQRGNRRQRTFFHDDDYQTYIRLMAEWHSRSKVKVWAYCLMLNHIHLIAVSQSEEGLRHAMVEEHREYIREINF